MQHQQESPVWGEVKKQTLFNANSSTVMPQACENCRAMEQLCEKALGQRSLEWGSCRLDSSALVVSATVCYGETVFQLQLQDSKHSLHSLVEKESEF